MAGEFGIRGRKLLFGHELVSFDQGPEGVNATVRNVSSGAETQCRAKYLVGADGGRMVGKALGNKMVGPSGLAKNVTVHFSADLSKTLIDDRVLLHFFIHPTRRGPLASGALVPAGPNVWGRHSAEWIFHFMVAPDEPARFDDEMVTRQIRELLKLPELPMKVHKISHWMIEAVLAEKYRFDRVILCGDAVHRHPPASGLGLNTGIQDANNLACKLALVTRGVASNSLLDTYESERRPIGSFNVAWALSSYWNHLLSAASIFAIHPSNVYELAGQPDADNEISGLFADTPDGRMRRVRMSEVFHTHRIEMFDHDVESVASGGDAGTRRAAAGTEWSAVFGDAKMRILPIVSTHSTPVHPIRPVRPYRVWGGQFWTPISPRTWSELHAGTRDKSSSFKSFFLALSSPS